MQYTIKEFSKLINKSPSTLRNWDKSGFFKPSYKGKNGYRYYDHNQLLEFKQSDNSIQLGVILPKDKKEAVENYLIATGKPYKLIKSKNNYCKLIGSLIEQLRFNDISKIIFYTNENFKTDLEKELLKQITFSFSCVLEYIKGGF